MAVTAIAANSAIAVASNAIAAVATTVVANSTPDEGKKDEKLLQEVDTICKKLYIHNLEDWYSIPKSYLPIVPGIKQAKKFKSIEELVHAALPAHAWDHARFVAGPHNAPQSFLYRILRSIFPRDTKFILNARSAHGVKGRSGQSLEIDIYLPDHNLGFEYQDLHHYFHASYGSATLEDFKEQDQVKRARAYQKGITLIHIPFWWDWNEDSLISTIKSKREDLLPDLQFTLPPIEVHPPEDVRKKYDYNVPGLGTPMLVLHSPSNNSFFRDTSDWWIFEKYDGVRAIWNPVLRSLYSRWGTMLNLSAFVLDSFSPSMWLDGEIWFGRHHRARSEAVRISKGYLHKNVPWDKFQYMVFDSPGPVLRMQPYTVRYKFLTENLPSGNPLVKLAPYETCNTRDEIETMFFQMKARQGEGIIVRNPRAAYMHGYSPHIYKHKGQRDAEAEVIKKTASGVYLCRVNTLQQTHNVRQEGLLEKKREGEENEENAENAENERNNEKSEFLEVEMLVDETSFEGDKEDIAPGTFVSFRYSDWSTVAVPSSPKIYLARDDVQSWDQVLHSKHRPPEKKVWKTFTKIQHRPNLKDPQRLRAMLDEYAKKKDFDPLQPDNWYILKKKDVFDDNDPFTVRQALIAAYPELSFSPHKFSIVDPGFYNDKANLRKIFDDYAKSKGFDPLLPDNWYKQSGNSMKKSFKLGGALNGKALHTALQEAYSFLEFQADKFHHKRRGYYTDDKVKLNVIYDYARGRGFDPLVPENWYSVKYGDFQVKGGRSLLLQHGDSIQKTLMTLLPNIGLDETRFNKKPGSWTAANRKKFFDDFAHARNFDPLAHENWYNYITKDFVAVKGGGQVLLYYNKSVQRALKEIYPQLAHKLVEYKFHSVPKGFWDDKANRRKVFDEVAQAKDLKDVTNVDEWKAKVTSEDFQKTGAGNMFISLYSKDIAKAVKDVYAIPQ